MQQPESSSNFAPMPIEDVASYPLPGVNFPVSLSFSANSRHLAYLHSSSNELTRDLYHLDMSTGYRSLLAKPLDSTGDTEENLSLEEKLRRERQRQLGVGITSYSWCPVQGSTRLLIPLQGNIYVQNHPGEDLQILFDKDSTGVNSGAVDPQWSPDGQWIGFIQGAEVYIISSDVAASPTPIQITTGARGSDGITNGLACFLTQEELGRYRGFWWSPDSNRIAFEEVDERAIPKFRILHSGKDAVGESAQEDHRYPFAGGVNPRRRLGVVCVPKAGEKGSAVTWMNLPGSDDDFYISRVNWLPNGSLSAQLLNRLQTELELVHLDPRSGTGTVMVRERSDVWVNCHYLFRTLDTDNTGGFRFLWGSERTGFMHIYLYHFSSNPDERVTLVGALTAGDWSVEAIEGVDIRKRESSIVYVSGTLSSSLERHLYAVPLAIAQGSPMPPLKITTEPGMHTIVMDHTTGCFVDICSSLKHPPTVTVKRTPSFDDLPSGAVAPLHVLHNEIDHRTRRLWDKLGEPEIVTLRSRDDQVDLCGALYRPDPVVHGPGPYPTLISVYGGPHVQRVSNSWSCTSDMRAQRFRDLGYAVFKLDNRGSSRRGLAFEGIVKNRFGCTEILDQEDGVQWLVDKGICDPSRVGIYGWSYGGYMSVLCLMKAGQRFKLAVAGAPVTSWDGYDTCYTERYMSTPQLNPIGYDEGNVMRFVRNMRPDQKLLLVHGLIDENVHFRHTARLINALVAERKSYDLLLFPDERHSPRSTKDRIYMEKRVSQYVLDNL